MTDAVLELTRQLMACESVTPDDAGCQEILTARLEPLGFSCESIDAEGVKNLWATIGRGAPHLLFAGHTDVVPPGPLADWQTPPFVPTVANGSLFGRGAADMKSSLAAMVVANERFLGAHSPHGTISFLITSDEEGDATHGTSYAIDRLIERDVKPDYCIVGEPSSSVALGDVVRCGRRGSLNARLTVHGVQGHVAYPQDADNPIHGILPALAALTSKEWDKGNDYYPPTSLQCSNITGGTGATNVIPGHIEVLFNIRFNTEQTSAGLERAVQEILQESLSLDHEIDWRLSGDPFLTERGQLTGAVTAAIREVTGLEPELSTDGGTSDGRFIAPWGKPGSAEVEVVELGPKNATIHKVNETVDIADLDPLARIYERAVQLLMDA